MKFVSSSVMTLLLFASNFAAFASAQAWHDREWARDVLGVSANATPAEIKSAYRQLAKHLHPDRGGSTEAITDLNEAYEIMGARPSAKRENSARAGKGPMAYAVPPHRSFMLDFKNRSNGDEAYRFMDEWDDRVGNALYRLFALTIHKTKRELANQINASGSTLEELYSLHVSFTGHRPDSNLPETVGDESEASLRRQVADRLLAAEFYHYFRQNSDAAAALFIDYLKVALPRHDFAVARGLLQSDWVIEHPVVLARLERLASDARIAELINEASHWQMRVRSDLFTHLGQFVRLARAGLVSWEKLFESTVYNRNRPTPKNLEHLKEILSHVSVDRRREAAFHLLLTDEPLVAEIPELRAMILNATPQDIDFTFPQGDVFSDVRSNRQLLLRAISNIERLAPGGLLHRIESLKTEIESGNSGYGNGRYAKQAVKELVQGSKRLLRELRALNADGSFARACSGIFR